MIGLRHLIHPVRSARSLCRRIRTEAGNFRTERFLSKVRRGSQDFCWCGGKLAVFAEKVSFGMCEECGCYVNRTPPLQEELNRLYSFGFYWHTMQEFRGHPAIEDRTSLDHSDGRVRYWLSLLDRCQLPGNRVLEVGCAHAVLLQELSRRGFRCVGVEVDPKTAQWTRDKTGLPILSGVFPDVDVPECDLFLSFDVLEHSASPEAFLRRASQLLAPEGIAVIQTPIEFQELDPPFGDMFDKVFDDAQHLFIFSRDGIRLLSQRVGLTFLSEHQWRVAHEIVVLKKGVSLGA